MTHRQLPRFGPRVQIPSVSGRIGEPITPLPPAYQLPTAEIIDSFPSPSTSPAALAFDSDAGNLISADGVSVYTHIGVSAATAGFFNLAQGSVEDFVVVDGNLIRVSSAGDLIYVHNGITSSINTSFATPAANPRGLAFHDGNLISSDISTGRFYIHDGISASILDSFAVAEQTSFLSHDGTNLIGGTTNGDFTFVYDGISAAVLSSFVTPGNSSRGITFANGNLMSADSGTDLIYTHGKAPL